MIRRQSNRVLVGIYSVWGLTMVAIGVGHVTHREDVGTVALITQLALFVGTFLGNWMSRGER